MKLSKVQTVIIFHYVFVCSMLLCSALEPAASEDAEVLVEQEAEDVALGKNAKLFLPAEDWRTIQPDETVFAGLHYRINMATGLKEAKLLDGDDGKEYYRLLNLWVQDNKAGKSASKNGGFKISMPVKIPRRLVTEDSNSSAEGNSSTSRDYGLALVPNAEGELKDHNLLKSSKRNPNSKLVQHQQQDQDEQPLQKQQMRFNSFFDDLRNLDDSKLSLDQEIDELLGAMKKNHSPDKPKFRTYQELAADLAELELLVDTEENVVVNLVKKYQRLETDEEKLRNLDDIEYLLHKIDNAQTFINTDGFSLVVSPSLNSGTASISSLACKIVSACVQNFPKGQIAALEAGLLHQLVSLVTYGQEPGQSAALSSLGSLVRNFPLAQHQLVKTAMPALYATLLSNSNNIASKSMALLSDLLVERLQEVDKERAEQLATVGLEQALLRDIDWCKYLVHGLNSAYTVFRDASEEQKHEAEDFLDTFLYSISASESLCSTQLQGVNDVLRQVYSGYQDAAAMHADPDMTEHYAEKAADVDGLLQDILKRNTSRLEL